MKPQRVIAVLFLLSAVAFAGERAKSLFKVSHLGPHVVAVACADGSEPQPFDKVDGAILLSCK